MHKFKNRPDSFKSLAIERENKDFLVVVLSSCIVHILNTKHFREERQVCWYINFFKKWRKHKKIDFFTIRYIVLSLSRLFLFISHFILPHAGTNLTSPRSHWGTSAPVERVIFRTVSDHYRKSLQILSSFQTTASARHPCYRKLWLRTATDPQTDLFLPQFSSLHRVQELTGDNRSDGKWADRQLFLFGFQVTLIFEKLQQTEEKVTHWQPSGQMRDFFRYFFEVSIIYDSSEKDQSRSLSNIQVQQRRSELVNGPLPHDEIKDTSSSFI